MNMNTDNLTTAAAPAAWIGWDWADQHHDLFLETAEGKTETVRLAHRPDELHAWLQELGRRFAHQTVVLCLEASRSALLPIFLEYPFLELYPINPKSMARFREVVRPSGSKSDQLDCKLACQLVKSHRELLHRLVAEDPLTEELAQMVRVRRDLVNQRTLVANRLKAALKLYYPLALELLRDDTTTALAADFVLRFPTLRAVQETALNRVRRFFLGQGCRLTEGLEQRLAGIASATGVSQQAHWNNPNSFLARSLAQELKVLTTSIEEAERQIRILAAQHPNRALAQSAPGAAAVLEPRLMTVLGTHPETCASARQIAVRDGVAPRRVQSGNSCVISRRMARPEFDHQTWIEFAKCSTLECQWARQFVEAKTKEGKSYYTAIRALAYKWIRIVYACWKNGVEYDEARYLKALQKHNSPHRLQTQAVV
jgi:transposase